MQTILSRKYILSIFRLTLFRSGHYQIAYKRHKHYKPMLLLKIDPDPVKHCSMYKQHGCYHVDSYLCDVTKCKLND